MKKFYTLIAALLLPLGAANLMAQGFDEEDPDLSFIVVNEENGSFTEMNYQQTWASRWESEGYSPLVYLETNGYNMWNNLTSSFAKGEGLRLSTTMDREDDGWRRGYFTAGVESGFKVVGLRFKAAGESRDVTVACAGQTHVFPYSRTEMDEFDFVAEEPAETLDFTVGANISSYLNAIITIVVKYMPEDDPEPDGIKAVEQSGRSSDVYDLQGRRVVEPSASRTPKGLYIVGGKKVIR
ncbi:MAG: hypothetical protein IJ692_02865 [Alloprevotella sp.]|nr:hypothetical protein [Alloprevotella sp.]